MIIGHFLPGIDQPESVAAGRNVIDIISPKLSPSQITDPPETDRNVVVVDKVGSALGPGVRVSDCYLQEGEEPVKRENNVKICKTKWKIAPA